VYIHNGRAYTTPAAKLQSSQTFLFIGLLSNIQSGPGKKITQRLMRGHFATVCSRIMWFSPKCSEKISVYQSM